MRELASVSEQSLIALNGSGRPRRDKWIAAIIGLGVLLRLSQFVCGRSLWCDEAALALNVLHRSFLELFRPLEYHQGAPIGFLLLEKVFTKLAGGGELALRALPLLAGVAAVFVFYEVAKLYVSAKAVPIAVLLFALSRSLVYYSSEAKQYSTDVVITVALLYMVFRLSDGALSRREILGASIAGSLAIWSSHPATFLLAGAAIVLIADRLLKSPQELPRLSWMFVAWFLSFSLYYALSLRLLSRDAALLGYWQGNFPPHAFSRFILWMTYNSFAFFDNPAPLNSVLGASFFVAGFGQLLRQRKRSLGLLLAPLLMLFVASWVHRYPLYGRLLMFVCPILLLVVAEGAVWVYDMSRRWSPVLAIALLSALLAKPIYAAADTLIHPIRPEDIKWAIKYIEERQRPEDVWYIYYNASYQFRYYEERYHLNPNVRTGATCGGDGACYAADLAQLRGDKRVWILITHMFHGGIDEGNVLQDQLTLLGLRSESYYTHGVRAYLYDFSHSPGRTAQP